MKRRHVGNTVQALFLGLGLLLAAWWSVYEPKGPLDYSGLDRVLRTCVGEQHVDWDALRASAPELEAYLGDAARVNVAQMSYVEEAAFWINTFNAHALWLALKGETDVLRQDYQMHYVGGSRLRGRVKLFLAARRANSLNRIRTGLLIRGKDPRLAFALSYAVASGPRLRPEAYLPDRLNYQLEDQLRKFFSNPDNFRLEKPEGVLYLSMAFKDVLGAPGTAEFLSAEARGEPRPRLWYGGQFVSVTHAKKPLELVPGRPSLTDLANAAGSFANFILRYCSDEDRQYLAGSKVRVIYTEYDWGATGARP